MAMMKFGSVKQSESLGSWNRHSAAPPPANAPRAGDVIFEIGVILAMHLALALVVTLLLKDCASC
jgi:hypothetical protein